jgi:hypothetical protein
MSAGVAGRAAGSGLGISGGGGGGVALAGVLRSAGDACAGLLAWGKSSGNPAASSDVGVAAALFRASSC